MFLRSLNRPIKFVSGRNTSETLGEFIFRLNFSFKLALLGPV